MGFSGGGSSILKSHTHDGTIVQDGGSLNMNNVTQGSLTAGDIVFSDGVHLQRLAIGTPAQQLQVNAGATAPEYFTPAAAASTWTEVINERDTVEANSLDTGFVDLSHYRVIDLFWTAYLKTGSSAMDVRFYDPDGNVASGAVQGTAGFHNGTFYSNGNQTSLQLSFGQNLINDRCIQFGMRVICSPVDTPSGGQTGFSYWLTQRGSYDASYIMGNGCLVDGFTTSTDLMFFNGIQDQSGNTWEDAILTVLASGDNTT
jgi:hypothetical protein